MSLINDMLKNLEKRFEGAQKSFSNQPVELQEEETIFLKALGVTASVVALSAVVWCSVYYYHRHKEIKDAAPAPAALSVSAGQVPMGPQPVVPPPPKLVNAIRLNDLPNQTELDIDLNSAPTYLTATDPTTNTLTLTLQNTYLTMSKICQQLNNPPNCATGNTIPLPMQGTALQSIQVEQNDGQSLILNIKLSPTATLKGSQLILNPISLKLTFDKVGAPTGSAGALSNISNNGAADPSAADSDAVNNGPSDGTPDTSDNAMLQPVKSQVALASAEPFDRINQAITQHDFDKAQMVYSSLPDAVKNSAQGAMAQTKIDLGKGNNSAALSVMESVPFENQSASFYALYAATLEFNKKHAQAVDMYKKLVNYWPDNPDWWLGLGIAALNNSENALAGYAFHHLISMSNLNPEVEEFVRSKLEELSIDDHAHAPSS